MKRVHLIISALLCVLLVAPVKPAPAESWTSVRTRNLFLISNAGPRELRQVAAWLELFNDAFSRLTSKPIFNSSVPTVGIVFGRDNDFAPFKPLYQGRPADMAGYFLPGADVNYIAISLESGGRDPLSAAFHEYVHLFVRNNLPQAPLWLNEGLAEYYSTFELGGNEGIVGKPIDYYLYLLRSNDLLPLSELLSVNHASAHYHERDKRGIFYAESWALVHYLMLGNNGQRQQQLARYLGLLAAGGSPENSFKMSFQTTLEGMEKELSDYVRRQSFPTQRASAGRGDGFGPTETQGLSLAEVNYYLGDLLLHQGRDGEAERYFVESLALDANLITSHGALGMMRVKQGRFSEALRHLERAAPQSENYLVHFFYAYALSRQRMTDDGIVKSYPAESLRAMRSHLQTTIKLAPNYAEAYQLLAFVNLVANEQLDQSAEMIKRAMNLQPGRQELKLVLAQILLKQRDTEAAHRILESLARSDDKRLRTQAELLLSDAAGAGVSVPQFSTAAASRVVSVGQPGSGSGGMRIDTSGTLPAPEEVLTKYVTALGGKDRIQKITTRLTRGKAQVPGEFREAVFENYEKSPNKAAMFVRAEQKPTLGQGFDGKGGWRQEERGARRRLQGVELAEIQRDCDFYAPLRLNSNYASIKLLGRVKIGFREAYLMEASPRVGEPEKFYFEIATGMLIRWDGVRTSWRERALVEVYYDDWREVDGVKVPFRITRSSPHFNIAFTIEEVKYDVVIDDRVFTEGVK